MADVRRPIRLLLILTSFVVLRAPARGADAQQHIEHGFTVVAPSEAPLGTPVVVKIVYVNRSDKSAWKLQAPEVSKALSISFRKLAAAEDHPKATTSPAADPPDTFIVGVSGLGDVGVRDAESVGSAMNPAKTLSIPPGASHTIESDLTAHGLGLLNPGEYEVWAEDENEELNAAPVRFRVSFTNDSVNALAKTAGDVTAEGYRRQWCAHWLAKIDPGFSLHLPAPGDSADVRASRNAENERAVRAFRAFWVKAANLPETQHKLDEVNREAGLPAEGEPTTRPSPPAVDRH